MQSEPFKLFLSGPAGSGKTEVAQTLESLHGFRRIGLGDLCRAEARRRGWPEDRFHLQAAGDAMRAGNPARLAALALAQGRTVRGPVVIEGVRLVAEATYLRAHGVIGVAVEAPEHLRVARLRARDGSSVLPTHATEREAASLPADLRIQNDHEDRDALRRQVRVTVGRAVMLQAERRGQVQGLALSPAGLAAMRRHGDDLDRIARSGRSARRTSRDRAGLER